MATTTSRAGQTLGALTRRRSSDAFNRDGHPTTPRPVNRSHPQAAAAPKQAPAARDLPGGPGVRRWAPVIESASRQTGVPVKLIAAVMTQESDGQNVRSSAGALGPMQLLPSTAAQMGVDPHNPVQNILGGARYLHQLLVTFHGNVKLTLAAYNAGPGAVLRYGGIPPYAQTQNYVRRILRTLS